MFSHIPHRFRILCIFLVISLISAQDYYIDSSNVESTQTGDIANPFQTLSAAFNAAQTFISANTSTSPLAITFYCKQESVYSLEENSISLTLNGTDRSPSTILITAYGSQSNLPVVAKPPVLHLSSASFHLALSIPKVKLTIENFNFEFQREGTASKSELILIEGKDSEVTFNQCGFQNSEVNLNGADNAIIRLKTGRYLFKKCHFTQLDLNNSLIVHDDSESSFVKYELNQFQNIIVNASSLIRAVNTASFDFTSNQVEKTSGRLLNVTKISTSIISENNFTDVVGQFPLYFNSAKKLIFGKNKISFATQDHASHEGFLSVINFNLLGLSDTTISEYFGLSSAISVAIEDSYNASHTPMVMLQGLTFKKNALCVHDDQINQGVALVNIDSKQKALISVDNTVFSGNTFHDMRENPVGRSEGASTLWINALESSLKIRKSTFEGNKADRALSNLYVSVGDLNVVSSTFKSNGVLEGSEASANSNSDVIFSNFGWFGLDLIFIDDTFQTNYNDYGGAISIREAEGLRIPHAVSIENCVFEKNKAKEGGAIYTNVVSNILGSIQLEKNRFEGNMADIDPDYSESSKIITEANPKLYMQVISQSQQKDYRSGEFTLQNTESGENTGYAMEFYIAKHKGERTGSDKKYYATITIASSLEGEVYLVNNFTNKLTGPSIELSSFAVVAPAGSLNLVKVTLQNKDDPHESYSFEFKVGVGLVSHGPEDCEKGEIFLEKEQTCVKCPPGTYSLSENALVCQPCPLGADCSQGGDQVKALPGFWRDVAENENVVVYSCVNPEKCLGENQCAEGYAGPLCEACNTKDTGKGIYRPFLRNTCKSCNSKDSLEIVGDVVGLIAPIAILLYTVYTIVTAKKGATKQFSLCLYCNLLFSYMQNLFILGVLEYLPLPHAFNYIVNVIANPSFPIFGYLTCYFPGLITSSDAYMGILSLFAAVPLTKILIIVLMMKLIARRGSVLKSSLLGLIWLAFLETPGIVDFCLRFFDCRQAGNWVYSPFFLDLECDTPNFELLTNFVLLPVILLLTLVCPLAITYSLSRGSLRSDEVESQKNLRVMVLARSADQIIKSHRSWVFFYFASFGRLGLLLLSTSDTLSLLSFSAVALYFAALALMNKARKIIPFKGWRSSLLFVDMLMLLASSILGYGLNFLDDGTVKKWLLTALWVGNALYLFYVNVFDTKVGDLKAYGKLQEENASSSEEESGQHKQNSEQLDETM